MRFNGREEKERRRLFKRLLKAVDDDIREGSQRARWTGYILFFATGNMLIFTLYFCIEPDLFNLGLLALTAWPVWSNGKCLRRLKRRIQHLSNYRRSMTNLMDCESATAFEHHLDQALAALAAIGITPEISSVPQ